MAYIFESRERMVRFCVPSNSIIGEVGVFKGEFAKFLHSLNPQKLILFDLFQGVTVSGDQDGNNFQYANLDDEYRNLSNLAQQNIVLEKGDSSLLLSNYPNEYFDMIYLDGDHSYEGVKNDLINAYNKIKNSGYIMGHDYEMNMKKAQNTYNFGVKQAVDEFCINYKQSIISKAIDGCVSYCIHMNKN